MVLTSKLFLKLFLISILVYLQTFAHTLDPLLTCSFLFIKRFIFLSLGTKELDTVLSLNSLHLYFLKQILSFEYSVGIKCFLCFSHGQVRLYSHRFFFVSMQGHICVLGFSNSPTILNFHAFVELVNLIPLHLLLVFILLFLLLFESFLFNFLANLFLYELLHVLFGVCFQLLLCFFLSHVKNMLFVLQFVPDSWLESDLCFVRRLAENIVALLSQLLWRLIIGNLKKS